MRFIPAIFLVFSFNCFCVEDHEGEKANYRCWMTMSVVASALQSIPQIFEIGYAASLASEVRDTNQNTTAGWMSHFATLSACSNAVAVLTTLSLVHRSVNLDMTPAMSTRSIKRRRLIELAYATKALSSAGMQAASSYFLFSMYPYVSAPSLLPAAITSGISLAIALVPPMGAVALVINSCMQRRGSTYTQLSNQV